MTNGAGHNEMPEMQPRDQAEQLALLAAVMEHASELVIVTDADTNLIYANQRSEDILGYRIEAQGAATGFSHIVEWRHD